LYSLGDWNTTIRTRPAADRTGWLSLEEAADLLEIEDDFARLLLARGGVDFEIRRGCLQPVLLGGSDRGKNEREQRENRALHARRF